MRSSFHLVQSPHSLPSSLPITFAPSVLPLVYATFGLFAGLILFVKTFIHEGNHFKDILRAIFGEGDCKQLAGGNPEVAVENTDRITRGTMG